MGMVFQSYALWPHMTVGENVGYPLKLRQVNGAARQKRVMEALEVVELGAYFGRSPQELSGGQRQRVALARCLVSEPRVVLLDEPLANLDRHLRATMEQTFREFHRRTGATFVYVTHDQAEAMALASHIAVMHQGELMQWGTPQQLYQQPQNSWVAGFIGQGSVLSLAVSPGLQSLDLAALHGGLDQPGRDKTVPVLVRPEHVQIARQRAGCQRRKLHLSGGTLSAGAAFAGRAGAERVSFSAAGGAAERERAAVTGLAAGCGVTITPLAGISHLRRDKTAKAGQGFSLRRTSSRCSPARLRSRGRKDLPAHRQTSPRPA